jgi:hypothetical protein
MSGVEDDLLQGENNDVVIVPKGYAHVYTLVYWRCGAAATQS